VVQRLFLKKNELPACCESKGKEFIIGVCIIAENDRLGSELTFNCLVFSLFVAGRVVAIVDEISIVSWNRRNV
jgi:hypothetical protein